MSVWIANRARVAGNVLLVAGLAGVLLLPVAACREPAPPEGAPKLLLLVVVDQFRADYLERFDSLWTGGLRRMLDEGAVFTDAHHRHSKTHTATGHASISTGCHPRRHGIIANYWEVPQERERIYSVDDEEYGTSPAQLLEPTLGDWLKQRSGRSRVFAASPKDRAAVLLAGHQADAAFWYDNEIGGWESSDYYDRGDADWVEEFNGLRMLDQQLGEPWRPLPIDDEELGELGVEVLDMGPLRPGFPHPYGGLLYAPSESFYRSFWGKPWQDEYLARFAERLIVAEDLGADGWTDLLALSFSVLDSAGHSFGPDSPQVLDVLRHFDLRLGELLEFVDQRIGLDNVVVALTSDHGVAPMPELGRSGGGRLSADGVRCFQRLNGQLAERFGEGRWLLNGPFFDPETIAKHGVERQEVEAEAVRLLSACPGVARVWRRQELVEDAEPAARLFANSFHPERSADLVVQFEPFFQPTWTAATHGSCYAYDTHVPLVLRVPGRPPHSDPEPAATIDLAPTLAALAGLPAPQVDGTDLGPRLGGGG